MNTLIPYIQEIFGQQLVQIPLKKSLKNLLPLFITATYNIKTAQLFERTICLLFLNSDKDVTPEQLSKHKEIVEQTLEMPSVFVIKKIASYNTKRIIERRISFIVPQKQLFIPDLMMDFRKVPKNTESKPSLLSPMAQLILLYHLQKESLNGKTIKQVATLLDETYLNVNRAINNLDFFEICDLQGGKERIILFESDKKQLWKKSLNVLTNPIKKTLFTDSMLENTMSGMNALAHYTMLNDERKHTFAISNKELKKLNLPLNTDFGEHCIQIWKYDPKILSSNGYVDRLSLYLQFMDTKDERIESALDLLIEQTLW